MKPMTKEYKESRDEFRSHMIKITKTKIIVQEQKDTSYMKTTNLSPGDLFTIDGFFYTDRSMHAYTSIDSGSGISLSPGYPFFLDISLYASSLTGKISAFDLCVKWAEMVNNMITHLKPYEIDSHHGFATSAVFQNMRIHKHDKNSVYCDIYEYAHHEDKIKDTAIEPGVKLGVIFKQIDIPKWWQIFKIWEFIKKGGIDVMAKIDLHDNIDDRKFTVRWDKYFGQFTID